MKKHVVFMVAIFFIAVALLSCTSGKDNAGTTDGGVSFESFSPRSISVKNNTGERLIAKQQYGFQC